MATIDFSSEHENILTSKYHHRIFFILFVHIVNVLLFYRGPQGRMAILANCAFLLKYCINKKKNK